MLGSRSRCVLRMSRSRVALVETLEDRRLLTEIGGTLASDTVLTAEESPYTVTDDIVVPEDVKLTIEPGVRLEFNADTGLDVRGQLFAEGTPWQRIVFDRAGADRWSGVDIRETLDDNRIAYADMIGGDAQGEAVNVQHARLLLDNVVWSETTGTILELEHPSLIVRNSHFPQSNGGEIIHGTYIENDEYLIIDGNVFENSNNGGDVIDVLGADRPGPVMQILNNVFMGGGDDGLDLDGTDAHVEGNLFMGFHKNTGRATSSNAIATGLPQSGESNRTQVTVVRNIFIDNDHALLLKEDAFATVKHNVFVGMTEAVIQFNETDGSAVRGPGKGALIDGNIFHNNASLFKNLIDSDTFRTDLTVIRSLLPDAPVMFGEVQMNAHSLGAGNIDADPMFVDAAKGNFRLQDASPAIGAGPAGFDMGAYVDTLPAVRSIARDDLTDRDAVFAVAGPSTDAYRYRLADGAWSQLLSADDPIELLSMDNGNYSLEVVAQDSAGEWIRGTSPAFGERSGHIIAPTAVRVGERLPAVIRVYDHLGRINSNLSTPSTLTTNGIEAPNVRITKGVGTLSTPVIADDRFDLSLPAELTGNAAIASSEFQQPARHTKSVQIIGDDFPTLSHQGELAGDNIWSAHVEHRITDDFLIPPGSSLRIEPGTRIALSENANIRVEGTLEVLGTDELPIFFTSAAPGINWGGIRIVDGEANLRYAFFTGGGGDESQEFGHSNSQPVLRADGARLDCDNCFVIDNIGKGFASTNDAIVTIHDSVISNVDTGGEFNNSQVTVTGSYIKDIPNGDGVFADDDNDGFYFSGVHTSGEASRFVDSFILNTKDDGIDHNGAALIVERAWIEGTLHEGIASSNRNSVVVSDSVVRHTNQGVEAGYGSPDLSVLNSVIVDVDSQADPDSLLNAGVRFGDGYDGRNGSYRGHITASEIVVWNSGDNIRNYDGEIPGPQIGAIEVSNSLTNDADFDGVNENVGGIPLLSNSMHLLRGSAGFTMADGLPIGRIVPRSTVDFSVDSELPSLRLSEFLASPAAGDNQFVEIVNFGDLQVELDGIQIATSRQGENAIELRATLLASGDRLSIPTNALSPEGGSIFLLRSVADGSGLIDAVSYGAQITGQSVARNDSAEWNLSEPTPGTGNVMTPVAPTNSIRINEWSPNNGEADFIEFYNSADTPASIGGAQFNSEGGVYEFSPLSFLDANEFFVITGRPAESFSLPDVSGRITLVDSNQEEIDAVSYQFVGTGQPQGRSPDGSSFIQLLVTPTPGSTNADPIVFETANFQDGISPQEYSGTSDVWLRGSNPDTNYGSDDRMDADSDSSGNAEWSLLRWDVSTIPDGSVVRAATITLTLNNASSDSQPIYAMNRAWTESQATWNLAADQEPWSAPGTSDDDRGVLMGTLSSGDDEGTHVVHLNQNGIGVLQNWIDDPTQNFGVIIIGEDDGIEIRTREYETATERPNLSIDFTSRTPLHGDLDDSGIVDEGDITLLCGAFRSNDSARQFDLNSDGRLDAADLDELILNILQSTYGDANLDGAFNSTDFVFVFQRNEYEDEIDDNSTWSDGDWNCDGDFTTTDLIVAFQAGEYVRAARTRNLHPADIAAARRFQLTAESPDQENHGRLRQDETTTTMATPIALDTRAVETLFR